MIVVGDAQTLPYIARSNPSIAREARMLVVAVLILFGGFTVHAYDQTLYILSFSYSKPYSAAPVAETLFVYDASEISRENS